METERESESFSPLTLGKLKLNLNLNGLTEAKKQNASTRMFNKKGSTVQWAAGIDSSELGAPVKFCQYFRDYQAYFNLSVNNVGLKLCTKQVESNTKPHTGHENFQLTKEPTFPFPFPFYFPFQHTHHMTHNLYTNLLIQSSEFCTRL